MESEGLAYRIIKETKGTVHTQIRTRCYIRVYTVFIKYKIFYKDYLSTSDDHMLLVNDLHLVCCTKGIIV